VDRIDAAASASKAMQLARSPCSACANMRGCRARSTTSRDPPKILSQLTALVKTGLRRMQYRPGLLDGFLARTRLGLTPFCNPHAIEDLLVA
jgi:hypothetical protein